MKNRNEIKIAKVTLNTDDSEQFPQMQTTYMGKVCDVALIQPYGLTSRPPSDALAVVLNQQGQEGTRMAVAFSPNLRSTGLKAGETKLENMVSGVKVYLTNDGDMIIDVPRDMTATVIRDILASAKTATVNITEKLTINANELEINVPTIEINATDLTINTTSFAINTTTMDIAATTINISATVNFTGALTSNGYNISNTHRHSDVTSGLSDTGEVT